jgi:hypothetical protein
MSLNPIEELTKYTFQRLVDNDRNQYEDYAISKDINIITININSYIITRS